MFHFDTREQARAFARKKSSYRPVDCGKTASRRWGVIVLNRSYPGVKKA